MSTNKPSFKQAKHTLEIFDQQGIDETDMLLLHDGLLSDFLEGVHLSRWTCLPTRDELRVFLGLLPQNPTMVVDYDSTSDKMIAAGQYDCVKDDMAHSNKYEGVRAGKGTKRVKIRLLESNLRGHNLQENGAEVMVNKLYRLASWEEVLTFGVTFPNVQRRCPHGIFGKSYGEGPDTFQPNLWGQDGNRGLSLRAGGLYCNPGTHFLFVER